MRNLYLLKIDPILICSFTMLDIKENLKENSDTE